MIIEEVFCLFMFLVLKLTRVWCVVVVVGLFGCGSSCGDGGPGKLCHKESTVNLRRRIIY